MIMIYLIFARIYFPVSPKNKSREDKQVYNILNSKYSEYAIRLSFIYHRSELPSLTLLIIDTTVYISAVSMAHMMHFT